MGSYYDSRGSFRKARIQEDVDPMTSLSGVGDIMLVFACGLMVALVMAWNLDLAQFRQVEMDQELQQDDVTEMNEQLYGEGDAFVEMGKVYQDPNTGKYYLVEEDSGSSAANSGTQARGDGSGAKGAEITDSSDKGGSAGSSRGSADTAGGE